MHWFKRYFPRLPLDDVSSPVRRRRLRRTDSPGPYVVAAGVATGALGLAVGFTEVPTAPLLQIGTTFVLLAFASRRIRERRDAPSSRLSRVARRISTALDDVWGLEFYVLAAVSALIWMEFDSLLSGDLTGSATSLLEAAVWWYPMWMHVAEPLGVASFTLLIASAWTFWLVLGLHPEEEPWLR